MRSLLSFRDVDALFDKENGNEGGAITKLPGWEALVELDLFKELDAHLFACNAWGRREEAVEKGSVLHLNF